MSDFIAGAQMAAGIISDAITSSAVTLRESDLTFTGPQVADYLTGLAADINRTANETFGQDTGVDL